MNIKYQNKVRLAKYIKEHNGIDVDPRSIFDVQVKRLHEYKRQLLNILHVMYLYNQIKGQSKYGYGSENLYLRCESSGRLPDRAKLTIKLINSVADVINNDTSINGKLKVVFIEDYRVSNAETDFCSSGCQRADFHRQQGGVRYRQHEVHAERCADAGHDGWCERGDRRGGRQGERIYLRSER